MTTISLLLLFAMAAPADTTAAAPPRSLRLFFQTAVLLGGETETTGYDASPYRLHSEFGLELRGLSADRDLGRRLGLAFTGSIGQDDFRLGLGPRLTWSFRPDWAWQFLVGPVWSSEAEERGLFDTGIQARAGLIYRDTASLTVLWQNLPFADPYQTAGSSHLNSLYGGLMLHGSGGTVASFIVWGALVAVMVAYLASYGG